MRRYGKKLQNKVTKFGYLSCRSLETEKSASRYLLFISVSLLLFVLFIFAHPSNAQINDPTSVSATRSNERVIKEAYVTYGAEFNVQTFTGLNTAERSNYQGQYSGSLGLSIPTQGFSAIANFGWEQEYSYEKQDGRTGEWVDPSVVLIKSLRLKNSWIDSLAFVGSSTAAIRKESKMSTFQGAVGGSVSAQKRLGKIFLSQGVGYSRSFFEYDIQDNGTVNSPNTYSLTTSTSYSFNQQWILGGTFRYLHSISYQDVGRSREIFSAFLAHRINRHLAISGGFFTLRGTLEPDGQTNRLRIIDPNSTVAYVNLGLAI